MQNTAGDSLRLNDVYYAHQSRILMQRATTEFSNSSVIMIILVANVYPIKGHSECV
jgi:hypothetical protein